MSFTLPQAIDLIDLAKANGRLAHAYLITGPVGSGKEALAVRMVGMVNPATNASALSLNELRDSYVSVIGPESKSRRISIKAIRTIEHTLQMAAPSEITKFAIIKDADRMGIEAENAFLKTLEEPPKSSRLLLLSSRPEMLLETILSRCIRVSLSGKPGPAEISESARAFLDSLRRHAEKGGGGISGALGLMAKFAGILKEEKALIAKRNEEALKAEVAHYRQTTEGDYLKQREEYYKALTEAEYLEQRNRLIDFLMMWFGDAMRQQNGGQHLDLPEYADATGRLAKTLSVDELGKRVEAVETLRGNLATNVFEALALEVGFIRAFG
jgi:DNA polymerase-3 subunit delta'